MKLTSVCIPSYNAAFTIKRTVKSVLDSEDVAFEIIVSDDASTDETVQIVDGFTDGRVAIHKNSRTLGAPVNWNQALKEAKGDYIGLLNHDDLYGPFWLAFATYILQKYPHIGWVSTAFRVVDSTDRTLFALARFNQTGEVEQEDAFVCAAKLDGFGPVYLVRRHVLEQVGFYDETAGPSADNDLFLRLASRTSLYYSSNPHHAAWRIHSTNLTYRWKFQQQIEEGFRILDKIFNDVSLPPCLYKYKDFCYSYHYKKVVKKIDMLLEEGDIASAQSIIGVLSNRGYKLP
jgi:glycosyltransferase involved in cell wall biosynthesis